MVTTGLLNQLCNTHHSRRARRSRSGCSSGSGRSRSGKWRGRCMVGVVGRSGILNLARILRLAPRTTTTTTLSRPGLIIIRPVN
ncbi:hypothetical protein DY000_02043035 [Brassica cretica]|uniref:Uncharacterized protein n=1 Tax=Brassica cretica TaxID=69181 RepID=A0ABQ7BA78_BRACR|nr:hypothetical protein DY000_02043035 [Brassica cretica]